MLVKSVFVATISEDKANSNESTEASKLPEVPSNLVSIEATSASVETISADKAFSSKETLVFKDVKSALVALISAVKLAITFTTS